MIPPFPQIGSIFWPFPHPRLANDLHKADQFLSLSREGQFNDFLTFLFVFANFTEEEEVEVDVVTIENSKREQQAEELMEAESEKDCETTIAESAASEPASPELSSADDKQEFPDDEKSDFVGKIRTRRHRKVLSSDGLNYRDGNKVVKNISSSGESDESENDSEFTRATHNVLERKRRNDLKLKFQKLRDCVPELKDNERAPKVSILRKSWEYISHIKQQEIKLLADLEKQKKINAALLRKLLALNQTN